MMFTRRKILAGGLAAGLAASGSGRASAQAGSLFPFVDDQGKQVYNYRLPAEPSLEGLPGIVWTGSATPEVILVEFFDYNCGFCHAAAPDLRALVATTPNLRLGLVNNPILSLGSVQSAKVQQGVLRTYGPAKALAFHDRLYAGRGPVDGPAALAVVASLGLDAKAVEAAGDLPQVGDVVKRQAHLADALGFSATPSFMIDGIGILGYPGPKGLARAVAAVRQCDRLTCS